MSSRIANVYRKWELCNLTEYVIRTIGKRRSMLAPKSKEELLKRDTAFRLKDRLEMAHEGINPRVMRLARMSFHGTANSMHGLMEKRATSIFVDHLKNRAEHFHANN